MYCHICHTRFAIFFPLPSGCISSLMSQSHYHSYKFIEPFYPLLVFLKKVYGLVNKFILMKQKWQEFTITLLNAL